MDPATTDVYTYVHTLPLHDALPILADKVGVSTEALTEVVLAEAKPAAPVSIIGDAVEQDIEKVTVPLWRSWVGSMKAQRWTRRLRAQRRQGRRAVVWFCNGEIGRAHV